MNQPSFLDFPIRAGSPSGNETPGQQAVKSGQIAESTIYSILKERGYEIHRQHAIGQGIYGSEIVVDFYVPHLDNFPKGLIIESKWQEKAGSVDEKFPYLVENIRRCYPCPALIVYGGGGARPTALAWLRRQADGVRIFAVFTFEEFITWTIRNL